MDLDLQWDLDPDKDNVKLRSSEPIETKDRSSGARVSGSKSSAGEQSTTALIAPSAGAPNRSQQPLAPASNVKRETAASVNICSQIRVLFPQFDALPLQQ